MAMLDIHVKGLPAQIEDSQDRSNLCEPVNSIANLIWTIEKFTDHIWLSN